MEKEIEKSLSIIEMADILKLPHNSFMKDGASIAYRAKQIGYEYKDLGFVKVTQSVSDMPDSQLNTIDTFQNKNRIFKEDERDRFRNY